MASSLEKEIKRQEKINLEIAERQARQVRAKAIVDGASFVSGFRIMDVASEDLLREILAQYDGREDNFVHFDSTNLALPMREFALDGYETLRMYGMINLSAKWMNGAMITLLDSGKYYFEKKEKILAQEKEKTQEPQNVVTVHGNGNNLQIQSNTINSTQTQEVKSDIDFEAAEKWLNDFSSHQQMFEENFGKQTSELVHAINEATDAIKGKEQGRLQKAFGIIKSILENAGGSILATGALVLLNALVSGSV